MTLLPALASFAFEPIVSSADGTIYGVQLVYTGSDTYGFAPAAGHQAPAAERLFEALAEWQQTVPSLRLTIPVSVQQLASTALANTWLRAADRVSVGAATIELGLDPTSLPSKDRQFGANLAQLGEAGAGIAQLGFGMGYATMAAWTTISFTRIELHESLVEATDDSATKMLDAISSTNEAFGFRTTASGVATAPQTQMVRNAGIASMRGPAAGPMLAGNAVQVWLQERASRL